MYGVVFIGVSIYVIGDFDIGKSVRVILLESFFSDFEVCGVIFVCFYGLGINYDYVREFKRSTGIWYYIKLFFFFDFRRIGCVVLRIVNCKFFRL